MSRDIRRAQRAVIMGFCALVLGYMWFDLSHKVESGKEFKLNDKWYRAVEVTPTPTPAQLTLDPPPTQEELERRAAEKLHLNPPL